MVISKPAATFNNATSKINDTQQLNSRQHGSPFPLMALPKELVLRVMGHMSVSTLYCFRQTSNTARLLFNQRDFQKFHEEVDPCESNLRFNIENLVAWEKMAISNSLHNEMRCSSCLKARENGLYRERAAELFNPRWCDGCKAEHFGAHFFSEDRKRCDEKRGGKLVCIGRRGNIELCHHASCPPITWENVEECLRGRGTYTVSCTDRSHEPQHPSKDSYNGVGCAFPRLLIKEQWPARPDRPSNRLAHRRFIHLGYGWDLPLLDLDRKLPPSVPEIQNKLSSLIRIGFHESRLLDHRLCPHVSVEKDIQAFVESGICHCFTRRGCVASREVGVRDCECGRQEVLECRACGATYCWLLREGRIALSYRYIWYILRPTSPGWICLLADRFRDKVFDQDSQNVLWCDTPECWTNRNRRWENMLKEYVDCIDYDNGAIEDGKMYGDYAHMWRMSQDSFFQTW